MTSEVVQLSETSNVENLLRGIIDELRNIGGQLSRQAKQIEELGRPDVDFSVLEKEPICGQKCHAAMYGRPSTAVSTVILSVENRLGPILQEALQRYKSNSVPYWSTLYGTHLTDDERLDIPEEEKVRKSEWTSITGDCWKIPHDNRVTFCFLAPLSDSTILIKVRNFLLHFHKPEDNEIQRGGCFNIWDWFDAGISAYWCPGTKRPVLTREGIENANETRTSEILGNESTISPLVAPWRRIINLQGLTTLSNGEDSAVQDELGPSDLCPFLFSDSTETIFHQPTDEMIWRAVKSHLKCQRTGETYHAELETKGCILFHITFFEILKRTPGRHLTELWPCGELHSDGRRRLGEPRNIRESALTIMAIPSSGFTNSKFREIFWTMICLRPFHFPHLYYSEKSDDLARGYTHEMIDEMSVFIHNTLLAVIIRWEEIGEYFDEILSEKKGLLNPNYHDSLLTDDGQFSRSKKYFWAIGFLEEAGSSVSDNISQLERFSELLESCPPNLETARRDFLHRIKQHGLAIQKLQILKARFRDKKEEAMALRDGLFSASAVMESRASTQLGENIKLLTFVSIFFLPLTFCTSLWSISDTVFSLSAFAAISPIISICTYVIVFNLNNIVSVFQFRTGPSLIQRFIEFQINAMQNDSGNIWKERGAAFSSLRTSQRRDNSPSRWRILQFVFRQLFVKKWSIVPNFRMLVAHILKSRRGVNVRKGPELPISLGNLGDIRVRVEVDVESCDDP